MMNKRNVLLGVLLVAGILATSAFTSSTNLPNPFDETADLPPTPLNDTIPLKPRYDDFINDASSNPFDLDDPSIIKQEVEYDPATGNYIISERMGEEYFRMPTYLTFEEYLEYRQKKQEAEYFQELRGVAKGQNGLDSDDPLSRIDLGGDLSDRLFGGSGVDIQVEGTIEMMLGASYQYVENPALPERQRRAGSQPFLFDFPTLQMNVNGQIGEKLNFSTNYNANATFDFDNLMKLEYASDAFSEDDIIKTIEAGNVSLPLQGSLIQGAQNLFGLKTQLQFGHLYVTAIASQQKSEREQIEIKGGSQIREFEVSEDQYDVNRHFFLSHYNREVFEESLQNIPQIKSLFMVQQLEVWVTNDRGVTASDQNRGARDVVALTDMGEGERITADSLAIIRPVMDGPTSIAMQGGVGKPLPSNESNDLFDNFLSGANTDNIANVTRTLEGKGLRQSVDFEKTQARLLREGQDYTVDKQLGFISLNINLQPFQTLGVAYQYSYNGEIYKVGQLSRDKSTTDEENDQRVLFLKMLKATTPNVGDPIWDLMMKNIYNIGAYQVDREDFRLDIFYEDPGLGQRRFISEGGPNVAGIPLLQVFGLDRLNSRLDPFRDGAFDFVEGLTIYPRSGRIMFPVLEPFGQDLAEKFSNETVAQRYTYPELYNQTVTAAQNCPERSRYTIKGRYRNSISSEISLGAFNIPPGSVTVNGPGGRLVEGRDYEIDYNIGRIKILRDDILASGQTITVSFEDNTLFGLQTKTLLGVRADYKPSDNFNLGATYMQLFERPLTQKVNIGDDPINNKIYGLDMSFTADAPWITRAVDNIPFIDTKAPSNITFFAEAAALRPGHSRAVDEIVGVDENGNEVINKGGVVYLDDFEGSVNPISLMIQPNQWQIASVPQNAEVFVTDAVGARREMFTESDITLDASDDATVTGVNRARLNWYTIFNDARQREGLDAANANNFTARIDIQEVFPNRQNTPDQLPVLQTFDLSYYPTERGAYNFDVPGGQTFDGRKVSEGLAPDGSLIAPETRWGGIMRDLRTINDFERSNVEYIEMWVMSPFLEEPRDDFDGGEFYIELG
ncbi:MAG: cell surface protein SprA, partial [Bacteroidota bacterium]